MMLDADTIASDACLRPDVCVVGGGAAGIALTLSLTGKGLRVLLLEAGYEREDAPTQDLYSGEVADERLRSRPDKYRQRRMGGSTTTWGDAGVGPEVDVVREDPAAVGGMVPAR